MLAEQAQAIDALGKTELAKMGERWAGLQPELAAVAKVDPKAFAEAAGKYSAALASFPKAPTSEWPTIVASLRKEIPDVIQQVAAQMKTVALSSPGSQVALIGPLNFLLGPLDADVFAALEMWVHSHHPAPSCSTQTLTAPYPIFASTNLDTESGGDTLDPSTGTFFLTLATAIIGWDHKAMVFGDRFNVSDDQTQITVRAVLRSDQANPFAHGGRAEVFGFPYAHAWSQLGLTVNDGPNQVAGSSIVEPINIATSLTDVQVGPAGGEDETFTLTCTFDRSPGDRVVGYVASVQASVDVTVCGFAGAINSIGLILDRIEVHACSV
jgi:hypothetical protein